jgi:cell wall-associated NlpC family hydrolase
MKVSKQRAGLAFFVTAALCTGACASTSGARPRPFPNPSGARVERPEPVEAPAEPPAIADARPAAPPPVVLPSPTTLLLSTALDLRGVPYRNGGSDPAGFDCSGFTQWVFARNGIVLPRQVKDQFNVGAPIDRDGIAPGDLVFFATTSSSASHVGIALDAETFVHAPSSRGVVRVERITNDYWTRRFLGVRRVTAN